MPQTLIADIAVGPLGPGDTVTIPHGLQNDQGALVPDQVLPNGTTPIIVTSVDDQNVSFQNGGSGSESATFRAWSYHTLIRNMADDPPLDPFLWQDGSGGGGTPALSAVLGMGNTTGSKDILVSGGQKIDAESGANLDIGSASTVSTTVHGAEVKLQLGSSDPNRQPLVTILQADPNLVQMLTPSGIAGDTSGGDMTVILGSGHGTGSGGTLTLIAGQGDLGNAGQINLFAGAGGTGGPGGDFQASSGNAQTGSNQNGGILQFGTGQGDGTGNGGQMQFVTGAGGSSGSDGNVVFAPSGATSSPGSVDLKRFSGSSPVSLRFWDAAGSSFVALTAPSTLASNVSFALPAAQGSSGQAMVTDGSGNLSFASTGPFATGIATLGGAGSSVVSLPAVSAGTRFVLTAQDGGAAAAGVLRVSVRSVGVSFTIASSAGPGDTGVIVYWQAWAA